MANARGKALAAATAATVSEHEDSDRVGRDFRGRFVEIFVVEGFALE